MEALVISPTIQEFLGVRYYKCGPYFQRKGVRLHRVVRERANGRPVPPGWHVHHSDKDRANNQSGNLSLKEDGEHLSAHGKANDHTKAMLAAREAAKVWHSSPAGREWARRNFRENVGEKIQRRYPKKCEQCGKDFSGLTQSRFCSPGCKTKWRYAAGFDRVIRECVVCGKKFEVNKYLGSKSCSRKCAGVRSGDTRRGRPQGRRGGVG